MPDDPVIDTQAIDNLRALSPDAGDSAFLCELITIYLEDMPLRLSELKEALAKQDATLLTRAAHTIKGSSGNVGAVRLARLAQTIESHGKTSNFTAAAALEGDLHTEYGMAAEALKQITSQST